MNEETTNTQEPTYDHGTIKASLDAGRGVGCLSTIIIFIII